MSTLYDIEVETISGSPVSMGEYRGHDLLIVNLASKCGLTPQYSGLVVLHESAGVTVLGFPCNQFGAQEPGTHEEIQNFAHEKYGVKFPLFAKIEVNGANTHPLYQWLKPKKLNSEGGEDILWNFTKFLVDKNGEVKARFDPRVTPEDIQSALADHLK